MHYDRAYELNSSGALVILPKGKNIFSNIQRENEGITGFTQLMNSLRLIRSIYDKLSKDELLLLIYATYPTFIEYSNVHDNLVKNEQKRKLLASSLLQKGFITKDRYEELIEYGSI